MLYHISAPANLSGHSSFLPFFYPSLLVLSPLLNVSDGRATGDGSVFRNMAQGLAAPLQNPFSTDKNLISISMCTFVFVCVRVCIVVFVCPNEPCVFVHECAYTKDCIHFVCVCVYAHKFSAISFLLNDFPCAESIRPVGVRWQGKECDWWVEHAYSFRQEGLKIGRRVGQK